MGRYVALQTHEAEGHAAVAKHMGQQRPANCSWPTCYASYNACAGMMMARLGVDFKDNSQIHNHSSTPEYGFPLFL